MRAARTIPVPSPIPRGAKRFNGRPHLLRTAACSGPGWTESKDRVPCRGVRAVISSSIGLVLIRPLRAAERSECRREPTVVQAPSALKLTLAAFSSRAAQRRRGALHPPRSATCPQCRCAAQFWRRAAQGVVRLRAIGPPRLPPARSAPGAAASATRAGAAAPANRRGRPGKNCSLSLCAAARQT